ncbi:MAG: polyhydroxyalkanoic acid system family protein [Chloroflexi bacterium]|nr:polyhydroxyalkanoic acid system family protein [Chloroflexota bacterium]
MKVVFPHGTTRAQALDTLKAHGPELMARFGSEVSDVQQKWLENGLNFSFRTRGVAIAGRLLVGEKNVEMEANLPLLATLFEGQIRERVLQVMREILLTPEIGGKT